MKGFEIDIANFKMVDPIWRSNFNFLQIKQYFAYTLKTIRDNTYTRSESTYSEFHVTFYTIAMGQNMSQSEIAFT